MKFVLILLFVSMVSSAKLDGFISHQDNFRQLDHQRFQDQSRIHFGRQLDQQFQQDQFEQQGQFQQDQFQQQPQDQFQQQPQDQFQQQPQDQFQQDNQGAESTGELPEGVITDERIAPVGAAFRYLLETEDGTRVEQEGTEGVNGTVVITGSYSYVSPEGETITVNYVADETGFHPESPILPVGPEIPEHARAQIAAAAEQNQGAAPQISDDQLVSGRRGKSFF